MNLYHKSTQDYLTRIQQVFEKKSDSIDLSSQQLTEVPLKLKTIKFIKRLNLSGNNLERLPEWLSEFDNLEVLDLKDCNLRQLFPGINKLKKLKSLFISRNNLTELSQGLSELDNLIVLFAKSNLISHLPNWAFKIQSFDYDYNPVVDPPLEIYSRGTEAISNYIKEKEKGTQKIFEAKLLIVGEPGAGKTSLMRKIIDEKYELNPAETSTLGIEIQPYYFLNNGNKFRVNIWDFGGQEIYHSTHQFFLTKRSLYVLLADNRAEDTDFNYWMQTVELLSENSPLLITLNEKQNRKKDINISGMRERFTNLQKDFSLNLATDVETLKQLKKYIQLEIQGLSHIGDELPKSWVQIREKLEKKSRETPYISDVEYFGICNKIGGFDTKQAQLLSEYFHDIGLFLHFQENPVLKRWIILKPDWGTQGVYNILDDAGVIERNGFFTKTDIKRLWSSQFYDTMHDELIALMTKFELCYQIDGNETNYIVPEMLQRNKPAYKWDTYDNIIIKYEYEFMPKGIITRFIVRMQEYIKDQDLVWREGVILNRSSSTKAEIIQTYGKREFLIRVCGLEKNDFLTIILYNIDKINSTFKNIKVKKLVPCNCAKCIKLNEKNYYEYDFLKRLQNKNIVTHRCSESLEEVRVGNLLSSTFGNDSGKISCYLSYSEQDHKLKEIFLKHFHPIITEYNLFVWDQSKISPGDHEKITRSENLTYSNIFICLVTANYYSDTTIAKQEIERIAERAQTDGCSLIPIIMTEVYNEASPYADYKPVLYKDKPIMSHSNNDEALVDAIYQIRDTIKGYLAKKKNS